MADDKITVFLKKVESSEPRCMECGSYELMELAEEAGKILADIDAREAANEELGG